MTYAGRKAKLWFGDSPASAVELSAPGLGLVVPSIRVARPSRERPNGDDPDVRRESTGLLDASVSFTIESGEVTWPLLAYASGQRKWVRYAPEGNEPGLPHESLSGYVDVTIRARQGGDNVIILDVVIAGDSDVSVGAF